VKGKRATYVIFFSSSAVVLSVPHVSSLHRHIVLLVLSPFDNGERSFLFVALFCVDVVVAVVDRLVVVAPVGAIRLT
jgi:hypothetical protein